MNIIATIVAVVVIVAGVIYTRNLPRTQVEQTEPEVAQNEATESAEEGQEAPTPTSIRTIEPQPTSTPAPQTNDSIPESDLQYPGAVRIRAEGNTTVYESQDDSDVITDWYKDKIEILGMTARSFVKTRTNGNVLNKLAGADGDREVSVEITKPADSSAVEIQVTFS